MDDYDQLVQQALDSLATADESWSDAVKQLRECVDELTNSNDAKHRYEQVRTGTPV